MRKTSIRFTSFPRTKAPPSFVVPIAAIFRQHEEAISTVNLAKGHTSDAVLAVVRDDLLELGFEVEAGKGNGEKVQRPVFYGENGDAMLRYEIDAFHAGWACGLEIEAGRAILGNAVFRDLFQAMVMTDVEHLCLAVPNFYKYKSNGKKMISSYYDKTIAIADALYGHSRILMPYGLTIFGY